MKSLGKLDGKAIVSVKGTELLELLMKNSKDQANKSY